jgi:hypothetical protein
LYFTQATFLHLRVMLYEDVPIKDKMQSYILVNGNTIIYISHIFACWITPYVYTTIGYFTVDYHNKAHLVQPIKKQDSPS